MAAPTSSAEFDRVYRSFMTPWGDIRIPREIQALVQEENPRSSLEFGCGVGRFSRYMAQQGVRATGVDFSAVAIGKAKKRVELDLAQPEFLVGDVTRLEALFCLYDVSFDVGCFHCLDPQGQKAYVSEVHRLLRRGGTHLLWALDHSPSDLALSPAAIEEIFSPGFELQKARASRRRFARSHWYWLARL